ncbi:MAG: hypothetical protein CMB66_00205 [Euryarchaeota archaeon]|nr:hypothetical protein [Euryarchaeota archaeon]
MRLIFYEFLLQYAIQTSREIQRAPPRRINVSEETSGGYPLVLHTEADPSRLGGTAVCGFSTVGSVGVIATSHLIKSLELEPMGTVLHPKFPAVALIHDSVPKHPVRVYQGEGMGVFTSEIQFPSEHDV